MYEVLESYKEELKELVTEFKEQINNNDFETIYKKLNKFDRDIISVFTALLLKNNINPLEYIDFVPNYFAEELDIEKFIIPDNVTSIGYRAFYDCPSLSEIVISNSVTSIGHSAFEKCTSLNQVKLSESLKEIDAWAFSWCKSLSEIVIPDSVTSIGSCAFYNCPKLKDVYYAGSEEDWENIDIGYGNDGLRIATVHYNS